jgi:hypothetical protein
MKIPQHWYQDDTLVFLKMPVGLTFTNIQFSRRKPMILVNKKDLLLCHFKTILLCVK